MIIPERKNAHSFFTLTLDSDYDGRRQLLDELPISWPPPRVSGYNNIIIVTKGLKPNARARNTLYKHNNTLHIQYSGNVVIFLFAQYWYYIERVGVEIRSCPT